MSNSNNHNNPVLVTGEERRNPAIRQLSRACIALARLRLEQQASAVEAEAETSDRPDHDGSAAAGVQHG